MRVMLALVLSFLSFTAPPPLDYGIAKVEVPNGPVLLAVWYSPDAPPIVTIQQPGPCVISPDVDHLSATYVSTGGALVTVYVDCTRRTSQECVAAFRARYEQLTSWLKIDPVATEKWRMRQAEK